MELSVFPRWPFLPAFSAVAAVAVGFLLAAAVKRVWFSPLSHVPGPWYTKISDAWLTGHVVTLRQCRAIDDLFKKYGPVVCISPSKVAFLDARTARVVYGTASKFPKDVFYKTFRPNGQDHADPAEHAVRRRAFAAHYSTDNLLIFQGDMHDFTQQVVQRLEADGGDTSFDCLTLFRHVMIDVIMLSGYGLRVGAVEKWANNMPDPLSTAITDWPKLSLLTASIPKQLWALLSLIPSKRWAQFCSANQFLHNFVGSRVRTADAQLKAGDIGDGEKVSLLVKLLRYRLPSNDRISEQGIIAEVQSHTMAGSDTTSTTASYLLWALSRNDCAMKRLQAELDQADDDRRKIPDMHLLQSLPYLNACIKEGLRLYSAVPAPLPRTVPGHLTTFQIRGYNIPPGTTVLTQAWTVHRREEVFTHPESFRPERWLSENEDMKNNFMPFGLGGRVCGGQNLAIIMLRIIIAAITRNFEIVVPPETNDASMHMCDAFVLFPAGMEARLRFMPRFPVNN